MGLLCILKPNSQRFFFFFFFGPEEAALLVVWGALRARRDSYRYFERLGTTMAMIARTTKTRKLGWSWFVLNSVCRKLLITYTFPVLRNRSMGVAHSRMRPFSSGFMGTAMIASTRVIAMEKPLQQVAR